MRKIFIASLMSCLIVPSSVWALSCEFVYDLTQMINCADCLEAFNQPEITACDVSGNGDVEFCQDNVDTFCGNCSLYGWSSSMAAEQMVDGDPGCLSADAGEIEQTCCSAYDINECEYYTCDGYRCGVTGSDGNEVCTTVTVAGGDGTTIGCWYLEKLYEQGIDCSDNELDYNAILNVCEGDMTCESDITENWSAYSGVLCGDDMGTLDYVFKLADYNYYSNCSSETGPSCEFLSVANEAAVVDIDCSNTDAVELEVDPYCNDRYSDDMEKQWECRRNLIKNCPLYKNALSDSTMGEAASALGLSCGYGDKNLCKYLPSIYDAYLGTNSCSDADWFSYCLDEEGDTIDGCEEFASDSCVNFIPYFQQGKSVDDVLVMYGVQCITQCASGKYVSGDSCLQCPGMENSSGEMVYGYSPANNTGDVTSCYMPTSELFYDAVVGGVFSFVENCYHDGEGLKSAEQIACENYEPTCGDVSWECVTQWVDGQCVCPLYSGEEQPEWMCDAEYNCSCEVTS